MAVEDATGAIYNNDGLDPHDLKLHVATNDGVNRYSQAEAIDHRTFISTKANIFIPATLENVITTDTAPLLNVDLIAEAANGPTDLEGDKIIQKMGILLIPDILCNAGGVIVSYFEWLQNKRSEFWELDEIDGKLLRKIEKAYKRVTDAKRNYKVDSRTAATLWHILG